MAGRGKKVAQASSGELVVQRGAVGGTACAQKRQARKDGWTQGDVRAFMEALAATLNASEAARMSGKSRAGAYKRKLRDPGFARLWQESIDVGYAELEAMLLRETIFGSETEELTLDGEGVLKGRRVKRGRDLRAALVLLNRYGALAERRRAEQMRDGPEAEGAVARMRKMLEDIRRRREAAGE